MQKLYSFSYPYKEIAKEKQLYMRGNKYTVDIAKKQIAISNGGWINTLTYYNAFSIDKWKKYTDLESICLKVNAKGYFQLTVYTKYLTAGDYLDKLIFRQIYSLETFSEVEIDLSAFLDMSGLLYFEIMALDDRCVFSNASFESGIEFNRKNIGIVICTYKREKYIQNLKKNFEVCTSRKNMRVFIADNGHTLSPSEDDHIYIFPNKNYGGAGGFTRGMLEINAFNKRVNKRDRIDYILLMDDDIMVDVNIFEKLVSFISLKKKCYDSYFLAGGMASLDYPYLQYEKYSSWRGDKFVQFGAGYDLRDINTIVVNEREDRFRNCSAGWWFSCFSVKMIKQNNYPFPCFFRGDDMEFTIRNGSKIITINGINVWHEPFYKKYSIVSENYYLLRNTLVINTLYLKDMKAKAYIRYMFKKFTAAIITYDYRSAELLLRAWRDYCKGISFFMNTDPEALNRTVQEIAYKLEPMEEKLEEYKFDDINGEIYFKKDKGKLGSAIRHLTLNGYLIPTWFYRDFGYAQIGFGAMYVNFYCVRHVFNFDPFSRKGYYTEIHKGKAIKLAFDFLMHAIYFLTHFKKISENYQCNFWRLQTEEFWRKYLEI